MKAQRFPIQVRQYSAESTHVKPVFTLVETVNRVLRMEQLGNFCPVFCTYKGNARCLVKSDGGDVSDPFRSQKSYAQSFFICVGEFNLVCAL